MIGLSYKRLFTSIKADFLFQLRHGFYYVYAVLTLVYLVLLSQFSENVISVMLPIVIYTDPAVLGLFFIGGIVLLEKEQGILALLYITPLKVLEYILSKVITLTIISLIAGISIAYITYGGRINFVLLISGIILTSVFFTLFGFIISTRAKSVNHYIVLVGPMMALFFLPCFALIPNSFIPEFLYKWLNLFPSMAALKIMFAAFLEYDNLEIAFCIVWLLIANIVLIWITRNILNRNIVLDN